jgi:hypothetical protein
VQICRTIKANRVLALDEIAHTETLGPIDLGRVFQEGSTIEGQVHVSILECDPQFDLDKDVAEVRVDVMIQKELTVVEPGGRRCPLEFAFRRTFVAALDAIAPSEIEALGIDLDRVQCQVLNVDLEDSVSFDTGSPGANASFAESLTIEVGLTLDVLEIMDVVICDEEPDE